uniref:Neur_chan_LBD domain-containing protein n=1 Tax=Heterorhabditis bacteriophora TaxID=37862 RepID=A0A1I7X8I6_HETBA
MVNMKKAENTEREQSDDSFLTIANGKNIAFKIDYSRSAVLGLRESLEQISDVEVENEIDLLIELYDLDHKTTSEGRWVETARWIKYEEVILVLNKYFMIHVASRRLPRNATTSGPLGRLVHSHSTTPTFSKLHSPERTGILPNNLSMPHTHHHHHVLDEGRILYSGIPLDKKTFKAPISRVKARSTDLAVSKSGILPVSCNYEMSESAQILMHNIRELIADNVDMVLMTTWLTVCILSVVVLKLLIIFSGMGTSRGKYSNISAVCSYFACREIYWRDNGHDRNAFRSVYLWSYLWINSCPAIDDSISYRTGAYL